MKASREQAERLHAFAEIDRKWQSANQGPDPVSIRPQVIFYAIAFMLTVGWTSVDLWAGNCGIRDSVLDL